MVMRGALAAIGILTAILGVAGASAQQERKTPYWASIAAGEAMMRTGPGTNYPATWVYRRADLPIKVVEVYPSWRKIQDPDGTTGWMLVNLLSDTRTAIVRSQQPAPMHEAPDPSSKILYRAEPGVGGRLSRCSANWCRFDVKGRAGYISTDHIWGTNPGETLS
jgi:SH3-like domain-containing protein